MGQFDGLLPRFTHGVTDFDFPTPPARQFIFPRAVTLDAWAPEADTGSTTEYVANHLYNFDFVEIPCQHIKDSELNGFITWWQAVDDGTQFTYYPDKDALGTSFTVVKAMSKFVPTRRNGLWYFDLLLRVVS